MRKEVIGDCELWLGDCREILPSLEKCDLCLTDPPYGIGDRLIKGGAGHSFDSLVLSNANEWDTKPTDDIFDLMFKISSSQIIWGGNFFNLPPCECPLCWDKDRPNQKNLSEWEYAWTSMVGRARLFKYCANGGFVSKEPRVHPTQKPVALMLWCLSLINDSISVFDPYMGSGTTGVACVLTNRTFIGIERDESYFNIACKRIEQAYMQPRFEFEEEPKKIVQVGMEFEG